MERRLRSPYGRSFDAGETRLLDFTAGLRDRLAARTPTAAARGGTSPAKNLTRNSLRVNRPLGPWVLRVGVVEAHGDRDEFPVGDADQAWGGEVFDDGVVAELGDCCLQAI
jgi:hypothetical protein